MRLLIAEPDLRQCWSARVLLTEAGHQVVGATTSAAAAAVLADETSPDLCLLDERLAYGEHWDALAASSHRLLLAASFGSAPPATFGWLAKPFAALELLEAVAICEGLLRREQPPCRVDRLPGLTLLPLDSGEASIRISPR
jgi:DNA-binding NtrC family response regulator